MTTKPAGTGGVVIAHIEALLAERDHVLVAIDGPCASGKTMLAATVNKRFGGNVLHMDDFFFYVPSSARRNDSRNPAGTWTANGSKRKYWLRFSPEKPCNTVHGIVILAISRSLVPSNRLG